MNFGLNSRIMVAGGGGSGQAVGGGGTGGDAGGLVSFRGSIDNSTAVIATQISGYEFGIGGPGAPNKSYSGGGGGYYGGGATTGGAYSTSGGSSFISGYLGCNAITSSTDRTQTDEPNHYSGKIFTNTVMKAGNEEMPAVKKTGTTIGNLGDGYAKITLVPNIAINGSADITVFVTTDYIEEGAIAYDLEGNNISSSIMVDSNVNTNIAGTYHVEYTVIDPISLEVYSITRTITVVEHMDYDFANYCKVFTVSKTATYKIQLWGAQGGSFNDVTGGKGAYTEGEIELNKGDRLYVYVGEQSSSGTAFNVGGGNITLANGRAGGGATDIRLIAGKWDDQGSLKSRIMVAARRWTEPMDIMEGKMVDMEEL